MNVFGAGRYGASGRKLRPQSPRWDAEGSIVRWDLSNFRLESAHEFWTRTSRILEGARGVGARYWAVVVGLVGAAGTHDDGWSMSGACASHVSFIFRALCSRFSKSERSCS